jgi:hypothetical protein
MLERVLACDWCTVVPEPGYRDRHKFPFQPDSFWIRTPSFTPLILQTGEDLCPFLKIRVTEHIRSHAYRGELVYCGVTFRGIPGEMARTVVIKNADCEEDITKLASESAGNLMMRDAGVTEIPKIIGFFSYVSLEETDIPKPGAVLVMEDVGQPLDGQVVSRDQMYVSFI